MRILWNNLIDAHVPADFSSQRANFWATNVQIPHLAVPWRTLTAEDQYYTLDAGDGATITATCAAIAGHNLSATAVVHIQAHTANAWTAPDLDEAFTWNIGGMMEFFTSTAKRFWRFSFDDPDNADGYVHIGRLGLGTYLQMPYIEPGATLPVIDTSRVTTSPSGQAFGDRGVQLLAPAFALPIVSHTERQSIDAMWAEVGNCKAVFLAVWEDDLDVQAPIYCRIDQESLEYKKAAEAGLLWSLELAFMEVL